MILYWIVCLSSLLSGEVQGRQRVHRSLRRDRKQRSSPRCRHRLLDFSQKLILICFRIWSLPLLSINHIWFSALWIFPLFCSLSIHCQFLLSSYLLNSPCFYNVKLVNFLLWNSTSEWSFQLNHFPFLWSQLLWNLREQSRGLLLTIESFCHVCP